jgi:hypothetical protein
VPNPKFMDIDEEYLDEKKKFTEKKLTIINNDNQAITNNLEI